MPQQEIKEVTEIINQLSEAGMADTVGLLMQNAVTIQQGMQDRRQRIHLIRLRIDPESRQQLMIDNNNKLHYS